MAADCLILELIHQRMAGLGYCRADYRISTHSAMIGSPTRISAFNEMWYLYSLTVPGTVRIESDSSYFSVADANEYKNAQVAGYKEFTGNIRIDYTGAPFYFEFIRVTIIKPQKQQVC